MPELVIGPEFFIILTNPYELAHKVIRDKGRPWTDNMAELRRMVVNTGALRFVQSRISTFCPHLCMRMCVKTWFGWTFLRCWLRNVAS